MGFATACPRCGGLDSGGGHDVELCLAILRHDRDEARAAVRLANGRIDDLTRGAEVDRGWLVVRRKRIGPALVNAAGLEGCAEVYVSREDAEATREAMTCPRDWDLVPVEVRLGEREP